MVGLNHARLPAPQFNRTTFNSRNYLIKIQFCSCMRGALRYWRNQVDMEQAISKQSMAPLCEPIYTLRAMMEPNRWQTLSLSSSSYRYCAVFIAIPFCPSFPSCTIVENWIIKFGIWIRGRKQSIWYMRVW